MPNFTPNYNLTKPLQTDNYNIDDANGNMDIIDTKLKEVEVNIESQKADMTTENINVLPSSTKIPTDAPSTYPVGISTMYSNDISWKTSTGWTGGGSFLCQVDTSHSRLGYAIVQTVTVYDSTYRTVAIYKRSSPSGTSWGAWEEVVLKKDMTSENINVLPANSKLPTDAPNTYPKGMTVLFSDNTAWGTHLGVSTLNKRYQIDTFRSDSTYSITQRVAVIDIRTSEHITEIFQRSSIGIGSSTPWGKWERIATETDINSLNTKISNIKSKKSATVVVGHSASGHTSADCDYLVTGTNASTVIQNAINSLPAIGGKVLILEGSYDITSEINFNKGYSTIEGTGDSTRLRRAFNGTVANGVIKLSGNWGKVSNLCIEGNRSSYPYSGNYGVYVTGANTTIDKVTCLGNIVGIYSGATCVISNNIFNGNNIGVQVTGGRKSSITGNVCYGNSEYGMYITSSDGTTISGNSCNEGGSGLFIAGNKLVVTGNNMIDNATGIYSTTINYSIISGNLCMRGTGSTADYSDTQYTIRISGNYNLVDGNNIMGKNYSFFSGTGTTFTNNKYS